MVFTVFREATFTHTDLAYLFQGTLACSPFHVRFGKFSLLRPFEKKVEFKVNGVKQEYAMKLGEGGEAFFVFETTDDIPASLQTSPLVSPAASPRPQSEPDILPSLQEPDYLDLDKGSGDALSEGAKTPPAMAMPSNKLRANTDLGRTDLQLVFRSKLLVTDRLNRDNDTLIAISRRI
jgi:phosphatidate phosphatase LPIN